MKYNIPILTLVLLFISCNYSTNKGSKTSLEEANIEKTFSKLIVKDFLSNKLLISKKGKLKGFKSLNIKGYRLYELDKKGNIIQTSDISNNYSVYSYDEKNRLIKHEIKQHNPSEIYHETKYRYSNNDSLIEVIKISYEDNKPLKSEVFKEDISMNSQPFSTNTNKNNFYISPNKNKIITYENEMIFCCGEIMEGKNKLIYYINQNELIDSLIIKGIDSDKQMKFEYEYQ